MLGVRERLGSELFARVAGPDGTKHAERIHLRPGPRWFDADSPIARVHGDAAMFIGGLRALLLQTLHPAAMRGVAARSTSPVVAAPTPFDSPCRVATRTGWPSTTIFRSCSRD